jgi:DNA-binding NtrC family response regulator
MTSEPPATILLVSSESVVRSVLREVLERAGHIVLATDNLGTGVELLAECPVDLLMTHPYIESMPGYEAAKYLRARNPRMAVLVVAGLLNDDRIRLPADLEEFEIFPPPFTARQLLEKVEKTLRATREREVERN